MRTTGNTIRLLFAALFCGLGLVMLLTGQSSAQPDADQTTNANGTAVVLELDGIIGPATSDFIVRGISSAEDSGVSLVILRMNTPGGLDPSMREIIRKILASRVPVATYVSPSGSRAASAGTYIMYASHVAAMAPATNLGSATPVSMAPGGLGGGERDQSDKDASVSDETTDQGAETDSQDDENRSGEGQSDTSPQPDSAMERKVVNDAVAYIKGLARLRGRNEEWAEQAVRSAVNLTAEDALAREVIDVVSRDIDDLLAQLDGRMVSVNDVDVRLDTGDLSIEVIEPDWRTRLLSIITNPNVAYVLMLLGVYGLFFELSSPGALFPGVLGAICLLLAFYSFQVLPVNYAGVALVLLGIAFMVGEMFMPSFGVMGFGGIVAFIVGSLILVETEVEAYQLSMPIIVMFTAVSAVFVFTIITLALRQRGKPVVSGRERMIGNVGEAIDDFTDGAGTIYLQGERWNARCRSPIRAGGKVRVREMDGLILEVEPLEDVS